MTDIGILTEDKNFRYRAGGFLVDNGKVLFVKSKEADHYYYVIGGGVHICERSKKAAEREFLEESGINARAERLAVLCENFFRDKDGVFKETDCHTLEFYYILSADEEQIKNCRSKTDNGEKLEWLTFEEITRKDVRPYFIKERILEIVSTKNVIHVINDELSDKNEKNV